MAANHNFRKLNIWKEGIDLVKCTYSLTKDFPREENYGLSSQIQRAAISIPSNIAEGTSKFTNKHFHRYLETALGSAFEWETQLTIAHEIGYINQNEYSHLETKIQQLQGMITRFMESISDKS